jgi:hypothetical protein
MEATDWLATAKRLPTSQSDDRPEGREDWATDAVSIKTNLFKGCMSRVLSELPESEAVKSL